MFRVIQRPGGANLPRRGRAEDMVKRAAEVLSPAGALARTLADQLRWSGIESQTSEVEGVALVGIGRWISRSGVSAGHTGGVTGGGWALR